ncbi:sodium- and chloride-dependent GABA transporter ine isoform X1 [Anopheles arabiensis]|uniref:sodium- and chloride-dependent GABA transporter ine isoform X1 n=1 Tax=Anopheles arabiensis TaxID=7173 RepID=UPI001AADD7C1|nr:sodium- and chloride-dependent GABA transporter ine isoform X1 [Anopheles arabiensis]XP_040163593.1 sodium- and chloride-dependent GABA transporter ine isoform X1 [Anopheles arabiensis]XP_040163594.1 sodium- and chloride-dependent GABA transporter ine isoform X1 [Anopheles arabiensis]XP_040163595.1 sodium- and chloride-dependent GABA transporter ine isoform X1 [Anopheles arabiensis]XP_040163596.1 sodium- and chloride-dependent GABA transporter ine isoform X1 [Anopheles arabiensis]XP_0401635
MDTQEQNQVEIQSVNPVPNRRPINDLHYTAINSNFRQQSKLNSGSNTSPPGSSAGGSEETKALLPTVGPSGRKFVIVPCQTGGAIGDPGGTVPSGSGGVNGAPIVKVEPGEGSLSSGPSSITVPTAPVGTYLKPKYFNSLRSVRSANDPQGLANVQQPQTTIVRSGSYIFSDVGGTPRLFSDATSIRSLASIGMGSTDGRRMVIRRVPNSPNELLTMINPPTPPDETYENESYGGMSDESDLDNLKPRKQHWANKMQFVLACIGYSVGLGNVWRFPYLCYKSGGGVFLVPYFIILLICGIPMLFMELAVGQYTGRGPIGALGQLCPLFKGTGLASVVVSFLMSTYYSVIIAYAIYYFFTSFRPELPWTDCSHRWNTPDCWIPERLKHNLTRPDMSRTPTEEFFENKVLQISHGIEYPGAMRWELVACLVCAWILVYFAIWKSIKSSAKVRYLTATLPFVLIVVFLGRSLTLEGADKGLHYFFRPNWEELGRANVWINAAAQNFNSIGIAFGSMISFASYNKYNNNILHDTLAVSFVNAITSLLVGIFAFATIGNIALEQNTTVENVISGGPGLIFVVYPQALAKMPAAQLWAVLFFFMLLCLGLNSQFAIVEVVVTSIQDGFPRWIKRKLVYHELLVLIVCVVSFFAGLPNLIQGGIYFFQLIDHYAASVSIMFLAFFETIAIAWFYGINRLSKNVKQMTGRYPSFYLRFCLLIAVPLLLISLWIFSLINYEAPTYHNGKYHYPGWAHGLGWTIASASLVCIPSYAVYQIVRAEGNTFGEKLLNTLKPNIYECKICGEHHCDHDFPDEELGPEMTIVESTSGAPLILQPPPPGHLQYTQLQQQQQHQQQHQQSQDEPMLRTTNTNSPPPTTNGPQNSNSNGDTR